MYTVYAAQVYEDAVADVSSSSSGSNSSGAVAMQQLDCAGYFARGLVLLARQKVYIYIHYTTCNDCSNARTRIVQYASAGHMHACLHIV
jgi:hypothetical protein